MKKNLIKNIAILTSGGDAPGMNAAIRAVVRTAVHHGLKVFGVEEGYQGLAEGRLFNLDSFYVANTIQRGGTILKTSRFPQFKQKAIRQKAIAHLKKLQIDGLIILGGDGSFKAAELLFKESGIRVIGIPSTIDNDVTGTDYCIGFDTACNTALQAIDKIRDTAFSLTRNFIIEVMGHHSGALALNVGIAAGAEYILMPEVRWDLKTLASHLKQPRREKLASIIVVAEAGEIGRSIKISEQLKKLTAREYKVVILGHIQRGGAPTMKDRVSGSLMGYHAVLALIQGENCKFIAERENKIILSAFQPKSISINNSAEEWIKINNTICYE